MKKIVCTLYFILWGCIGCGEARVCPYGVEGNADRKARGLPEIQPGWIYKGGYSEFSWSNPKFPDQVIVAPIHAYKKLLLNSSGDLDSEFDIYYSGKVVAAPDPDMSTIDEEISITYSFSQAAKGEDPWFIMLHTSSPNNRRIMSIVEAEKILASWNIDRLK